VGDDGHPAKMEQNEEHDFKIIKINVEEKKVGLSLRAIGQEASRATVESYKAENQSHGGGKSQAHKPVSSSTTTLGDLINWRKNER
jgi:small subunit ribosomal protein S1